jgi:uncharacterized membrane protein
MKTQRKLSSRDIIFIGMFAALCVIATMIKIPLPTGGMVHLGTACLFTVAILFGGVYAGLSGAIGSAFFDLMLGFSPYTLWSFVIKGGAGVIAGWIAKGLWPDPSFQKKSLTSNSWLLRAVIGCIVASAWTLGGYLLAWWQVTDSLSIAIGNLPSSLITSGVGMIVALLLAARLRKTLKI